MIGEAKAWTILKQTRTDGAFSLILGCEWDGWRARSAVALLGSTALPGGVGGWRGQKPLLLLPQHWAVVTRGRDWAVSPCAWDQNELDNRNDPLVPHLQEWDLWQLLNYSSLADWSKQKIMFPTPGSKLLRWQRCHRTAQLVLWVQDQMNSWQGGKQLIQPNPGKSALSSLKWY